MKKALLILILIFITTLNYAQGGSSKLSPDSVIQYTKGSFFVKSKYTIAGKQVTGNEIFARLMNAPASANEFKECKKYNNRAWYTCGAALSFLAASLIANGDFNAMEFKNTPSKLFLGIGCGLIIPEAIFAGKRNKHWGHSLELYNQQFQ